MLETNADLRFSKTDKMIKEAFLELIDTMDFEKINVTNITQVAKISRTTFYLHYENKYDLLEQIEEEILDGLKKIGSCMPVEEIATNGLSHEKAFSLLVKVYEYIKENQKFFRPILYNNADPYFNHKLNKAMKFLYERNIDDNRIQIPRNYAMAFIIGAQISIVNEWIRTGMKESPDEMVSIVTTVMDSVPKNIYK